MKSKTIAVITPNKPMFDLWVKENGSKTHKYIHIQSYQGMKNKHFSEVQKGYHWEDCKEGTFEAAQRRANIHVGKILQSVVKFRHK